MQFDKITDADFHIIRDRMLPHLSRRGKQRSKEAVLGFLIQAWPIRLEFEIARVAGTAFDAGEAGFTYTTGDTNANA